MGIPTAEEFAKAQRQDNDLLPYFKWIEDGELPDEKKTAKKIMTESVHFAVDETKKVLVRLFNDKDGNVIIRKWVVPLIFKKLVLGLYHDATWSGAHLGRNKTYKRIEQNFYFENMRKYIAIYMKSCHVCQRIKNPKNRSTAPMGQLISSKPWSRVSIDGIGPFKPSISGNTHAHVVMDECTRFMFILASVDKSAEELAKLLKEVPFRFLGLPEAVHTDRGSEYNNELLEALNDLWGIDSTRTTIYHPEGNAINERSHQFINVAITAAIEDDERIWDKYLIDFEQAWNTAVHEATGISPAEFMLGFKPRTAGNIPPVPRADVSYMDFIEQAKYIQARALTIIKDKRNQELLKRNKIEITLTTFKEGEEVLLYLPRVMKTGESYKLHAHWQGPYKIEKKGKNPKVYYLLDQFNESYGAPVSVVNLKPYHDRLKLLPNEFTLLERIDDNHLNDESESDNEENFVVEKSDKKDKPYMPSLEDVEELRDIPLRRLEKVEKEIILPDTREFRAMIPHEAYRNAEGKIVLKQRVLENVRK